MSVRLRLTSLSAGAAPAAAAHSVRIRPTPRVPAWIYAISIIHGLYSQNPSRLTCQVQQSEASAERNDVIQLWKLHCGREDVSWLLFLFLSEESTSALHPPTVPHPTVPHPPLRIGWNAKRVHRHELQNTHLLMHPLWHIDSLDFTSPGFKMPASTWNVVLGARSIEKKIHEKWFCKTTTQTQFRRGLIASEGQQRCQVSFRANRRQTIWLRWKWKWFCCFCELTL